MIKKFKLIENLNELKKMIKKFKLIENLMKK